MKYKYCPECGQKLVEKTAGDDGPTPFCESCGKYLFDTFPSIVLILAANEYNEIALLRQNYMSDKYDSFVSGFIKPGETAEETAVRELREELGLEAERMEFTGTYWFSGKGGMLVHGFIATVKKREFRLSSEVDAARWVTAMDAPQTMFPDKDGNAMYPIYRQFIGMHGLGGGMFD